MKVQQNIKSSKKIIVQLGIPFLILVSFIVTILIFGALFLVSSKTEDKTFSAFNILQIVHSESSRFLDSLDVLTSLTEEKIPSDLDFQNNNIFDSILSKESPVVAISVFDVNGNKVFSSIKSGTIFFNESNFFSGNRYKQIANQSVKESYLVQKKDINRTIPVVHRVSSIEKLGSEPYILVLVIDVKELQSITEELSKLTSSNVYIINESYEEVVGSSFIGDSSKRDFSQFLGSHQKTYEYFDSEDRLIEGFVVSINTTKWQIVAESHKDDPLPIANLNIVLMSVFAIVVILILVVLQIVIFTRQLYIPLSKFLLSINKFDAGDRASRVELKVNNELKTLATSFNDMLGNVENRSATEVDKLKKIIKQQEENAKVLLDRDKELRDSTEKIKKLDETKSMFVSVAAHQMRTPLSAVKWAIKMVADGDVGPINPEQKAYLMKGYESNERLIRLINDLLNVDKIESNKLDFKFEPVQVEDVINSIIAEFGPVAEEDGVTLQFEQETEKLPAIKADSDKMRNALQNLIDNAIKYTIGGGIVKIRVGVEGEFVKIEVQDTGIGIPTDQHEKVFTKFFRAKNAIRKETDGSGLGLFIVREIIGKHGGTISFVSVEDKGTTFTVLIPVFK